jgi:diadenosine tetraphosphate (Ap4A) HIT family hydrolase
LEISDKWIASFAKNTTGWLLSHPAATLWKACHAPVEKKPLGTLFLESTRLILDYAEMIPDEAASLGATLQRIYRALKEQTKAERIYQLSTIEGQPHFHAWIVPCRKDIPERGLKFLAHDDSCEEKAILQLVNRMHEIMK